MKRKLEWRTTRGTLKTVTVDSAAKPSWRRRYPHLERRDILDDLDHLFERHQTRVENQLNLRVDAYDRRLRQHYGTATGDHMGTTHNHQETDIERRH